MNPNPPAFEDLVRENATLQVENAYLRRNVIRLEREKADLIAENVSRETHLKNTCFVIQKEPVEKAENAENA